MSRFGEKVAIVTAAAQGIGRACCELLGAEGATIAAVDVDPARLGALVADLSGVGIVAAGFHADATDEDAVAKCMRDVVGRFGRVDILVNCVGGSTLRGTSAAPLETMSLQEFEALLRFNLSGTFLFCRAAIPVMRRQGQGRIVNVASIAARGTAFSNAGYSAAKAGIVALTTKLSRELGPYGIHCNAVAPGLTMTERMQGALVNATQDELARRAAEVPLGRFATAQDQAKAICFLASDDAAFITGTTLFVTGGV